MSTLTPNQLEAIRLIGVYTAGRYTLWNLSGPARASCRAHIMSELTGTKVPKAKAGVMAIEKAVYALTPTVDVTRDCSAKCQDLFREWSRSIFAIPAPPEAVESSAA